MRLLVSFTLLTICLTAIGQTFPTKNESSFRVDTLVADFATNKKMGNEQNNPNFHYWDLYTEVKYTYSNGNVVTIQNSGPRGGRTFTDDDGIRFGYRVYCARVINDAATPLELTIAFPSDSFSLPGPDSYMKVFLLPDTMAQIRDITLYDERLKSSYEAVRHTLPKLQKTINPKEAYLFRIVVLRHYNGGKGVAPRGGFALKGQDLFYRIGPEFDSALIHCGQVAPKD